MKRTIIGLAAVAALGFSAVAAVSTTELYPGWNMTGIVADDLHEYAANDPCPDGYETSIIYRWDGASQSWEMAVPGQPEISDFTTFDDPRDGYMVYCQ